MIKSPGILMKDKKDVFESKKTLMKLQSLMDTFKEKKELPFRSSSTITSATAEKLHFAKRSKTCTEAFETPGFEDCIISPGKLKNLSETTSTQMKLSKDILTLYGIGLVVENSNISRESYVLLEALIPEIGFFPHNFFIKLQITELVICKDTCQTDPSGKIDTSFSVSLLDTYEKVCHRLYRIILSRIIAENPDIVKKFEEVEPRTAKEKYEQYLPKIEEHFITLMMTMNHSFLKPNVKKLREALELYYPEAMAEERFKNRKKEKKKSLRVRFETDPI